MFQQLSNYLKLSFLVTGLLLFSCQHDQLMKSSELSYESDFEQLMRAITERDAETIFSFTSHADSHLTDLAWKALIHSELDSSTVESISLLATEHSMKQAWIVLSHVELLEELVSRFQTSFINGDLDEEAGCHFFIRVQSEPVIRFMLSNPELLNIHSCAAAMGSAVQRIRLSESQSATLFDLISGSEDHEIRLALLYGFWRSPLNRPEPGSLSLAKVLQMLNDRASIPPDMEDEFLLRIAGTPALDLAMKRLTDSDSETNVQFAVTAAGLIRGLNPDSDILSMAEFFLSHPNPNVALETLEALKGVRSLEFEVLESVWNLIYHHYSIPEAEMSFHELMHEQGKSQVNNSEQLKALQRSEPLLTARILTLYQLHVNENQFLDWIEELLHGEGIASMQSAMVLAGYVESHPLPEVVAERLSGRFLEELASFNRSVISVSESLMMNSEFLPDERLDLLQELMINAVESREYSLATLILRVMNKRGVDGDSDWMDPLRKGFRYPDVSILSLLYEPIYWILETSSGVIRIRLNPHSTPFTVSSIVYLTDRGSFDGVYFHRVVRNFVIQGGDFDRRDGFGGPEFRIPTEPASESFQRGSVGMASSGPDTEGSQFFITHTWTPHLDGLYTLFGTVVEGMEVVDRIRLGDKVLRARIEGE